MKSKPNKLFKESMKQNVGSLKRLTRLTNPSQQDKMEEGKDPIITSEMTMGI
jgi:hypothetical protein